MKRTTICTATLFTALLTAHATAQPYGAGPVTGEETWAGEISITSPLKVAPDARLVLVAGTRVKFSSGGTLQVEGTLAAQGSVEAPVIFNGDRDAKSPMVTTIGEAARLDLSYTRVTGANAGIAVRGGTVTGTHLELTGNGTGLTLEIKSRARLEDTAFSDNDLGLAVNNSSSCEARRLTFDGNQVGLGINNSSRLVLEDSRFTGNEVGYGQHNACDALLDRCTFEANQAGIGLKQTRRSPTIRRSSFKGNQTAVSAQLFSHVLVEGSTLADNQKGFAAVNFCGAFLRFNEFRGNDQAVLLDHKSNARIENNRVANNRVGLFADYSSYPHVRNNLFADNEWHVRLGIYQSSDWEQRQGSRGLMMGAAEAANSRNPLMLSGDVPEGDRVFSVAGNAWDTATTEELLSGTEKTNISRFWDGHDQEPVRYQGFGEGEYAVDVVRFSPPLTGDLPATGPGAWSPLSAATERQTSPGPAGRGSQGAPGPAAAGAAVTPPGAPRGPAGDAAPPGRP